MSAYLYLLFSDDGEIAGLGDFLAAGDALAAQKAERLLSTERDARRVEIWRGGRLLAAAG